MNYQRRKLWEQKSSVEVLKEFLAVPNENLLRIKNGQLFCIPFWAEKSSDLDINDFCLRLKYIVDDTDLQDIINLNADEEEYLQLLEIILDTGWFDNVC